MVQPERFPFRDDGPPSRLGPGLVPSRSEAGPGPGPVRHGVVEPGTVGGVGTADEEEGEAAYVRPYTVTGGRTRPTGTELPFEALVETLTGPRPEHSPESRRILSLTAGQYLSVAELSAHLQLAIGVVRVLVGDLADEGAVRIHGLTAPTSTSAPATTLSVLESVLNGISAL
jgi:hypothetical protein